MRQKMLHVAHLNWNKLLSVFPLSFSFSTDGRLSVVAVIYGSYSVNVTSNRCWSLNYATLLEKEWNTLEVITKPSARFRGVSQYYRDFNQITDE